MNNDSPQKIVFGQFELDVDGQRLLCDDKPIKLTPKAFETLTVLIRNRGRLVTKDEIINEVWRDTFVEEGSLTRNISVLRKIFAPHNYIETVPRRGYRFLCRLKDETSDASVQARDRPCIAVLPFRLLNTKDEEYLGVGLTDALITKLCRLQQIDVRPTSSVLPFLNSEDSFAVIGEKLGVGLLLDGNIQQARESVRLTVQLIDASSSNVIWSDQIDTMLTDFFTLQDTISNRLVTSLALEFDEVDRCRFEKPVTANNAAYLHYLRGRFYWNKRNAAAFRQAIDCFNDAIVEDPLFAAAYAGIADCLNMLNNHGVLRPHEAFPKAKAAALRAVEIDPNIAEAHASLAYVLRSYEWNFPEAEREFKLAISLNPKYSSAHQWYGTMLVALERFDEALVLFETAQRLDPLSLAVSASAGFVSFFLRDFDRLIRENLRSLEMQRDFIPLRYGLGLAYVEKQMFSEALREIRFIADKDTENNRWVAHLGSTLAAAGEKAEARKILSDLLRKFEIQYVSPLDIALIHARLGDRDEAFRWLDRSCEEREGNLIFIRVDPEFDGLRADSRFAKLLSEIGLENFV